MCYHVKVKATGAVHSWLGLKAAAGGTSEFRSAHYRTMSMRMRTRATIAFPAEFERPLENTFLSFSSFERGTLPQRV